MEAAEFDGLSPYRFRDIPQQRSPDGYTRVLDAQARRRLYNAPSGATPTPADPIGRLPQNAGETAIDNLVLPAIMRRDAARRLFVGHRIQQFFLRALQWKQRRLLSSFGLSACNRSEVSRVRVKEHLASLEQGSEFQQSLAFASLLRLGHVLESYGQLADDARAGLETFLHVEFSTRWPSSDFEPGAELDAFVEHCQKHPGRAFAQSAVQHKLMLFKAIASPALRVVWRSDMEWFTQHKYFAVPWTRKVPLVALRGSSGDEKDIETLRASGSVEASRFRKNVFAYGESHGLGQSGGGCAELMDWAPGSLMYEFGTLLCTDEGAKVPNHGVTDIEKIIVECLLLCPEGGMEDALPGEVLHDVGQNPIVASSIGPTQHTQVMRATASDFPLMTEQSNPEWVEHLAAWVDLVQVGESEDGFFVSIRTRTPDSQPVLDFLVGLRVHFLTALGRSVDFNVTCHPTEAGEFIVNFAPVACMQRIKVPKGEGAMGLDFDFQNPETSERFTEKRLPVASVDCSHGKGNVLAASDEYWQMALDGRPMLERLYDFNRKPGARAIAEAYLRGAATARPA